MVIGALRVKILAKIDPLYTTDPLIHSLASSEDPEWIPENYFSYFSTKVYVVGTQKNSLDEMVLLSTPEHRFKLMGKKIITVLH